jgi:DNA-binding transcriptional LysR family regulator
MEIAWLEDFLVLSKSLNFSRAAEVRNLTQSAFSRRIKQLENWLGVTLLDRSGYPATLTEEGSAFRRVAEEIVRTLHDERDLFLGKVGSRRKPFVSFSTTHTIAISYFPEWISKVQQEVGKLRTQVVCASTHECVQALMSGSIDFFLSYVHPAWPLMLDEEQYPSILIDREMLVPVCVPGQRKRPKFSLDTFDESPIPYLECGSNTITSKMVEAMLGASKVRPSMEVVYRNSISAALKAMALKGFGIAWLALSAVSAELESGALVFAGADSWRLPMELRIYRNRRSVDNHGDKDRIWALCQDRKLVVPQDQ